MKFAEVDLLGVYVAPISVMFTFSVYMIVLSSIVLTAAR